MRSTPKTTKNDAMIANGGINNIIFTVLFISPSKKSLINELNIIVLTNTNAKDAKIIEIIIITIVLIVSSNIIKKPQHITGVVNYFFLVGIRHNWL